MGVDMGMDIDYCNVLTEIKNNYNSFTKSGRKIADYVLNNVHQVLFMSITDLADACNVGDTSVFRFCRTLKLKGYQEFKMLLSLGLDSPNGSAKSEYGILNVAGGKDASLIERVYAVNVAALSQTMSTIRTEDLNKAVDILVDAEAIHFFGVGSSLYSALEAMSRFLRITPKVHCYEDSHMQSMAASMMGKNHAAIVISYSGATKDSLNCAQLAKTNGASVIAITRHLKSPLTAYADVILQCGTNEDPMQGGAISTKISQLFIIDLLYTEYYSRLPETSMANRKKTSSSVLEKMV
jgi:DNA-binding MurR/RpiR family transcriptional regulator